MLENTAFALVLLAAILHASWNALVKINTKPLLAISLMFGCICVLTLALVPWLTPLSMPLWLLLGVSLVCHFGYKVFLLRAFKQGDFSLAYPIARGSAPLWVLLVSSLVWPHELDQQQVVGALLIIAGILVLTNWRRLREQLGLIYAALATGAWIAAYSLLDGYAANQTDALVSYLFWLFMLDGLIINAYAYYRHQGELIQAYRQHWRTALLGGGFSFAAYSLCLWAMTIIPVAVVSALRETSVLVAVLIGVVWLKEQLVWRQYIAAITILLGLLALRLA